MCFPHLPHDSFQLLHSKKFFTRALGIPIWQFLFCHHAPKYACIAFACNLYAWLPPRTGRVSGSTALMLCKHILCISLPSFKEHGNCMYYDYHMSNVNDCYEACVGKCCIAPLQRILPPSCMDQLYSDGAAKSKFCFF